MLEKNDGAVSKLMKPAKYGFLVRIGNGRQYMPWIHINDLCNIYLKAIEDPGMKGVYNAVSPHQVTHKEFMNVLSRIINRPVFLPQVPAFIFRAIMGEMSDVILKGSRVSSEKIITSGFSFHYSNLEDALKNVLGI